MFGQTNLVVRLGEWDTQHTTEFYPHLDADVANVVVHESYNHARQNLHNDIALLFLTGEVPLQVCISLANTVYVEPLQVCFSYKHGLGRTKVHYFALFSSVSPGEVSKFGQIGRENLMAGYEDRSFTYIL